LRAQLSLRRDHTVPAPRYITWRLPKRPDMSTVGSIARDECRRLDPVVYDVSSVLVRLTSHGVTATMEGILQRIVEELGADRGTLLESDDRGQAMEAVYVWTREPVGTRHVGLHLPRLKSLLTILRGNGDIVASSDLAPNVRAELFPDVRSAIALPTAIGNCRSILVIESFETDRGWPPPLVERLRLLAEMLAGALYRLTQELALRNTHIEAARLANKVSNKREANIEPPLCDLEEIVGSSFALRAALNRVRQVAATGSTVLLLGETGTGKELFARAIHANSPRRRQPLVTLNCAALPASLVETELFGHQRGAFTGAVAERIGRFELANRGTLFLDEIGELPLEIQVKLLRVLQERTFERVGSSHTQRTDVRLIAATNRGLDEAVAAGLFRADLFYRLSVFPIRLPPLRERREDIPALVWGIIRKRQQAVGRSIKRVPPDVMHQLQAYRWPGNVRELENVVERALIHSSGDAIALDDFNIDAPDSQAGGTTLQTVERDYIQQVLQDCRWRINGSGNAAERLGIHPNTLRFRMKKLGIVRGSAPQPSSVVGPTPFSRGCAPAAARAV
jgi:formate hydrogenlyase transcriptional activator